MRRVPLVLLSLALLALVPVSAPAQTPAASHPLTVHDMLAMDRISDSQVSPDGQWIAFNSLRNDDQADIYIMRADGSSMRQVTDNPEPDWQPQWEP